MNLIQTCLLISCLVISAQAMFFELPQQREKCIIEEVPEDTLVTGVGLSPLVPVKGTLNASAYQEILDNLMRPDLWEQFGDGPFLFQHDCTPDVTQVHVQSGYTLLEHWDKKQNHPAHLGLTVTVKDPNLEVLLMKRFGKYGKFTFTSHLSGQHFLCVKSNTTRFSVFAGERLKVHLDVQMVEHTIDPSTAKTKDTIETVEFKIQHLIGQMQFISKRQDFEREREETFRQMSEETNRNVLWWAIIQTALLLTMGFWQMRSLKNFFIEKKLV